jgi:hypothetical protein
MGLATLVLKKTSLIFHAKITNINEYQQTQA